MHTQSDYLELEFYDDFVSEESPETETELEQGLSGTALESIFGHLLRRPLLTPEEEMELLARAKAGDEEAQARLVESNLRLVVSIARRYVRPGLNQGDSTL
jgi:RNA polymerase primary sigma factor